ncbi:hypothetical protein KR52_01190 [Synechococcus sp. KORDI-52]|uniref:pentapeptide repeat-containing protein n=1 Tax=Synechococcus sp. KORDI-52 TaxID=585425 RepID=UPI0004E0935C|nr:pentapeptide repeat-containing protein [Synechococcus sp. KORDI-52]AII47781.1 hypothetical protein KR52_01190 [Synechococcus sp. KORDI-52]
MAHVLSRLLLPVLMVAAAAPAGAVPLLVQPHDSLDRSCPGCDLRHADLRQTHLIGADFRGSDLRGADLREANLEGADLTGALLEGADLRGANLTNAELSGVDLRGADLRDARVINAYAPNAKTSGMRYAGASLFGSDLIIGGGE